MGAAMMKTSNRRRSIMATKKTSKTTEQPAQTTKSAKTQKATPKQTKAAKQATTRKMSALNAAAMVLGQAGRSMSCEELINEMASKGLWVSPGGKTPANTLSAALRREIHTKGKDARFTLAERGKFGLNEAK
jgi:hypothetical protein